VTRIERRLEDIVKSLSPEEKASLGIEDMFRPESVLSPSNFRKMLQALSPEEGRRYNTFMERFHTLRRNLLTFNSMREELLRLLLHRDRLLWYYAALMYLEGNRSLGIEINVRR